MSLFTQDSFTDTAGTLLEDHTGETGAVWTKNPAFASGSASITDAGRLRGAAGDVVYYESADPGTADYDVEADLYVASADALAGIYGRLSATDFTGYLFDYSIGGLFTLYTLVSGSTINQTSYAMTLTTGQTYHLRLSLRGSAIGCFVDGQPIISITDTNITDAGRAGLYLSSTASDDTGYQLDNFTGAVPATLAVTDANLFFSPFNWQSDGGGPLQTTNVNASSTFAQANTPGAYMKFVVNATSGGYATLLLDTTPLDGIDSGNCPTLAISLDGQAFTTPLLAEADGVTRIPLAGNLAAGQHTVLVGFRSVTLSDATAMGDRWNTPASVVKITGVELDGKGSAGAAPTIQPGRLLFFGDGLTEGADCVGNSNANADQDATQAYAALVAAALGAEFGVVGFAGQGWTVAGDGNVPQFYSVATPSDSTFDQYFSGSSRLSGGSFSPAPSEIFVMLGQSDAANGAANSDVTAAVAAWIAAARADAPSSRIVVLVPIDGSKRSAIEAGVTAASDGNTIVLDPAAAIEATFATGGLNTNDGVYPNARGHATLAAILTGELEQDPPDAFAASTGNFVGGDVGLSQGAFATG